MLDPANFGTPLTMLQIPARAIQRIQEKLADADCAVTYYAQDCRHFSDLRKSVSADDWAAARRSVVDVGYICRRCHIVYPGRTACTGHQEAQCYRDGSAPSNAIVKLEQLQYECSACRHKTSTIADYKLHCSGEAHRKATAAGASRTRVSAAVHAPLEAATAPSRTDPVPAAASTPAAQDSKPEGTGDGPPRTSASDD